ncbi:phosphotriesterase family protein [Rhodococcus artemisiae]|uniref:Phosphotriesterase n=1 Tax=Rhodococcus artemisiae TaxID=714159 RepID=A0ABU7L2Z8_9NOCA|nr:phosphotriesterase [Rhodococcus artemisiae]MEE2055922.1 phosphotriesterase [Rhodococcus artemisiae]
MPHVNTVLGAVPAAELGFVAVHEHIGYGMPGSELDTQWWKTPEQRYEETVPKLRKFHENSLPYGAATYVDATGICNGRDVNYYQSLSEKTGVHIVASTGFVGGDTALPFFERAGVDYLTDQFLHEITVGIGNTGGKAGIIKVGVSRGFKMKDLDLRIYRAAARAALATGVPIFTHLAVDVEPAIDIFREEGLPLDRVLFGHADDGVSQGKVRDRWIAEQGGRIGFDTFGYDLELPDPPFWGRPRRERLDHFLGYLRDGLVDRVLASADANCSPLGWPGVKGHTVNYLFDTLIPALREAGVDEATIHRIFVELPADFLSVKTFATTN